jgi:hypothetical protein
LPSLPWHLAALDLVTSLASSLLLGHSFSEVTRDVSLHSIPAETLSGRAQKTLVEYLQSNISQRSGRTYAGGLTKFEPREMERLIVPGPAMLVAGVLQ